ncbi:hypothetical protein F8388_004708 [Cannabis sativa]|uniref:Uncharacterized protein n=1 Tax=Cannabis sativa TaxID=3483 RepID=A0A7J6HR02_CANSA|nr:hypothetical protein F8388_004708 [Cannabis sativa]
MTFSMLLLATTILSLGEVCSRVGNSSQGFNLKALKPSFAVIEFWVNSYLQKFYAAQDKLIIPSHNSNAEASNISSNPSNDGLAQDNVSPHFGTYKLSVDASVRNKDCKIGFSDVVRIIRGKLLQVVSLQFLVTLPSFSRDRISHQGSHMCSLV